MNKGWATFFENLASREICKLQDKGIWSAIAQSSEECQNTNVGDGDGRNNAHAEIVASVLRGTLKLGPARLADTEEALGREAQDVPTEPSGRDAMVPTNLRIRDLLPSTNKYYTSTREQSSDVQTAHSCNDAAQIDDAATGFDRLVRDIDPSGGPTAHLGHTQQHAATTSSQRRSKPPKMQAIRRKMHAARASIQHQYGPRRQPLPNQTHSLRNIAAARKMTLQLHLIPPLSELHVPNPSLCSKRAA